MQKVLFHLIPAVFATALIGCQPTIEKEVIDGHEATQVNEEPVSKLSEEQSALLAKQMLKNFIKNSSKEISIEYIQKLVCEYFEVPVELLKSQTRKREIVQARQISMYLAKSHTKSSLKSIGMHFGGRDHSTVIYACQTVEDLVDTDKKFRAYVADIQKKLKLS